MHAGPNRCDRQRPLSETKAAFPGVQFSDDILEVDEQWETLNSWPTGESWYSHGENASVITTRCKAFLEYLRARFGSAKCGTADLGDLHSLNFDGGWMSMLCTGGGRRGKVQNPRPVFFIHCLLDDCRLNLESSFHPSVSPSLCNVRLNSYLIMRLIRAGLHTCIASDSSHVKCMFHSLKAFVKV